MKQLLLIPFFLTCVCVNAQSVIQSVNSGSIIASGSSVSVGEIVVVPTNQNQSSSGIIGILTQTQLEVPEMQLSETVTVYPNPTMATIFFQTESVLTHEKIAVFNLSGQLIAHKKVAGDNAVDLSDLPAGIYMIQFINKNIKPFKIIKH